MLTLDQIRTTYHTAEQAKALAVELRTMEPSDMWELVNKERQEGVDALQACTRTTDKGKVYYDLKASDLWKDKTESQIHEDLNRREERFSIAAAVFAEQNAAKQYANSIDNLRMVDDPDEPAFSDEEKDRIVAAEISRLRSGLNGNLPLGEAVAMQKEYREIRAAGKWSKTEKLELPNIGVDSFLDGAIMNTLFKTTAGWPPQVVRSGRVVMDEFRPPQFVQVLPRYPASSGGYAYMREAAITNAAVEKSEGAALGEQALSLTEKKTTLERLGVWIPVTDEQLQDEAATRAYLTNRLPTIVMQRLDAQALNGDGTSPNMEGLRGISGINTQAKSSAISLLNVYLQAATRIREDCYYWPDCFVIPVAEHTRLCEYRDSEGRYLWGEPTMGPGQKALWGISPVISDAMPANTGFMCATMDKGMLTGQGLTVEVGLQNDQFVKNIQTIRCWLRAQFLDFRPLSSCAITALNTADAA